MCGVLRRRGPDDRGVWQGKRVGFAHTRLSIIDLSDGGHQPMRTGHTSIVFNGEIYNYKELKKEVRSYSFQSESDTEVILALFEQEGVRAFDRLRGMFAFALYDARDASLYLVRDRLGKKPLYWGFFDGTLLFGSELKALMQHSAFKKEIDPEAVRMYLTYECVPTPFSIFKGVRKVRPGGYVIFSGGEGAREELYWTLPHEPSRLSFDEARLELDGKLADACSSRLVSDVPLGVFLSGGIDSSTVAYYAARASRESLKTFSIRFTDADFDESPYAEMVAKTLGVEHATESFSASRCIELIPDVFSYLDEPLADASALPTYLLSSFAKQHVSVVLGGDGADELFAGYQTFQADRFLRYYAKLPRTLRSLVEPIVRALPVSHKYFSLDFMLKRFIGGVSVPPRYRHQHWLSGFSESDAGVLRRDFQTGTRAPYAHLDQFFDGRPAGEFQNDVLWSYLRTYCMDHVLVKVDRMSMAHALEVRAPFLDHSLVTFVQNLPYDFKFRGLTGKYILKRLMRGRLPRAVVHRRKRGFAIPLGRWLQKELKPLSRELLSRDSLAQSGFFDPSAVETLLAEHEEGYQDHRKKLWTLMAFQLWYNRWAR
jgi:asparagine synthase (glutamine-hydrolysing)